jgi:hypothetical protein
MYYIFTVTFIKNWEQKHGVHRIYKGVSKCFRTEMIMKYTLTFGITH